VKNEEERLAEHYQYLVADPKAAKGGWHVVFGNGNEIFAEFGCGKGKFILTLAERNPNRNYVAFEGSGSIILRALEKAALKGSGNVVFVKEYIKDAGDYFAEGELSGIYLNFSDPWPKDRHARRRLTYSGYLSGYRKVLKQGSCVEFKTDNSGMFAFALDEFEKSGFRLLEATDDLHATGFEAKNAMTEYEDKFLAEGKKIHYCKAVNEAVFL
jgi:tRNA (guanine-N7-)-methyltransferase